MSKRLRVAVLLILIAIALLVGTYALRQRRAAKITRARSDIAALGTALLTYRSSVGKYPTTEQGLEVLIHGLGHESPTRWAPMLNQVPLDPWGNPYHYECTGKHPQVPYDLYSQMPDGELIGNWQE